MASLLKNIKSIYIFRIFVDNIPYIRFLKIVKHNSIILKKLEITLEYFQKLSSVSRVLNPSYSIETYYKYFKINDANSEQINKQKINSKKKINVNEWTLYKCLNSSDFNIQLNINDINFEAIITNAYKINLIINENTIKYLEDSTNEKKEHIYYILNKNIFHIKELTICKFNLNDIIVNNILYLLSRIFNPKIPKNDIKIGVEDKKNNCQYIKKFNFLDNKSIEYTGLIIENIDSIISLKNISLNIDYTYLSEPHIDEIEEYIFRNLSNIKALALNNNRDFDKYNYSDQYQELNQHTVKLGKIFDISIINIEILDLGNISFHPVIIEILNSKFNMILLKELKLKILNGQGQINSYHNKSNYVNRWNFY